MKYLQIAVENGYWRIELDSHEVTFKTIDLGQSSFKAFRDNHPILSDAIQNFGAKPTDRAGMLLSAHWYLSVYQFYIALDNHKNSLQVLESSRFREDTLNSIVCFLQNKGLTDLTPAELVDHVILPNEFGVAKKLSLGESTLNGVSKDLGTSNWLRMYGHASNQYGLWIPMYLAEALGKSGYLDQFRFDACLEVRSERKFVFPLLLKSLWRTASSSLRRSYMLIIRGCLGIEVTNAILIKFAQANLENLQLIYRKDFNGSS